MLKHQLDKINTLEHTDKQVILDELHNYITDNGYDIVEVNGDKPWGAYLRFNGAQADLFIEEFFPGIDPIEARLGNAEAELSPKILLVAPGQRLSWQYHHRRAERWVFLTQGAYNKSKTDEPGDVVFAHPGDVVQFAKGERHRLVGVEDSYTLVAEIWQHTDASSPSNEDDIVRLQDDYKR